MVLRRYDYKTGTTDVAAISILLPLTPSGARKILAREVDAVRLADADIGTAPDIPVTLMLDTWIVRPEFKKNESGIDYYHRRTDHAGYGSLLLPLHAGLFWDGHQDTTVFVEPDNTKIALLCRQLGFTPERRPQKSDCWVLSIKGETTSNVHAKREIASYVETLRSYPIRRVRARSNQSEK